MTTNFTWSARLLDAGGTAIAGASLAVELFDLGSNTWVALSQASTGSDGGARGRGEIGDDSLPFAPALRLTDNGTVMATTPAIARTARGLSIDFSEVRRAAVATPFIRTLGGGRSPFSIGGGVAATGTASIDMAALRAEVGRDFSDRLALRDREVADRDTKLAENMRVLGQKEAEINRLSGLVTARDQELAGLRQTLAATDVAALRAEIGRDFAERLATRDRDLASRDEQISLRDAKLAESTATIVARDAEIRRLSDLIAEKDRIINTPRAGAASVTGVTEFASTIGVQLDEAQSALKTRGFSLGAIEVNAKALLRDDGRKIEIPDRDGMKALPPGVLADLKFSYRPDTPPPDVPGQIVPDLMYLTENRARAVLTSLGLLLEASTGPAALNANAAAGQAMLQTPAAGASLPRGGRVHVIFVAATEQDDA
ncbi:MAG: hypothetical protein RIS17_96 [Pseudomonadota bacterium]|jgi:hypothetical protein